MGLRQRRGLNSGACAALGILRILRVLRCRSLLAKGDLASFRWEVFQAPRVLVVIHALHHTRLEAVTSLERTLVVVGEGEAQVPLRE